MQEGPSVRFLPNESQVTFFYRAVVDAVLAGCWEILLGLPINDLGSLCVALCLI
jgi:hypothetical protein